MKKAFTHLRRAAALLTLTLTLLFITPILFGCGKRETVEVASVEYRLPERLTAGDFDESYAAKMEKSTYTYYSREIYISQKNGALFVTASDPLGTRMRTVELGGGRLVGIDGGEGAAGSIYYYSADGAAIPLLGESCRALLATDTTHVLAVTANRSTLADAEGDAATLTKFYILSLDSTGGVSVIFLRSEVGLPEAVCAAGSDEPNGFFVALKGETRRLIKLTLDGRLTELGGGELLQKVAVTSMVARRDGIWCGTDLGIYRFDAEAETETWFPIDWAELNA